MRASNNTKITWTLAALFLLLFLSGLVLIMMISTVRRGKKEKADKSPIAQLNEAWGEPLPAKLEVVQMSPPSPELSKNAKDPAFMIARVRMSEAEALKLTQSGQKLTKGPGGQALSLNAEEVLAFWYLLAPQLPPGVDESQAFVNNPENALPPPVRAAVEGWFAGPGVEAYRHGSSWFAVDKKSKPWEIYLVVKKK